MTQLLGDVELVTKQELEAALDAIVVPEDDIDDKIQTAKNSIDNSIAAQKTVLESEIDLVKTSVSTEATARQDTDNTLASKITTEAELRETSDNALQTRLEREEGTRQAADDQIIALISTEVTERKADSNTLQANIDALSAKIDPATTELTQLIASEEQARIAADNALTTKIDTNAADIANEIIIRTTEINKLKETENTLFEDTVICARMSNLPLAQMTIECKDSTLGVGDIIGTVSDRYFPKIPVTFSFVAEVVKTNGSGVEYVYISARLNANGEITVLNRTVLTENYTGNVGSVTIMYITKE